MTFVPYHWNPITGFNVTRSRLRRELDYHKYVMWALAKETLISIRSIMGLMDAIEAMADAIGIKEER